ncbi:MAG: hypothetical protein KJ063_02270 [Anaerolineae bacterium]|nr:hypothetical protein [Anaerolineae bacterium]
MARRELSNTALHTLEDVYSALIRADIHLERLANGGGDMTRHGVTAVVANTRLAIQQAREIITIAHPKARAKALQRRNGSPQI